MRIGNVKLILYREIRDQLRDRRTLFMIFVLPMLLYPLLGMSFFQISQFMQEQPTDVLVTGARNLTDLPPLFENNRFTAGLFADSKQARLLQLEFAPAEPRDGAEQTIDRREQARAAVQSGRFDAALCFPEDFADQLEGFRQAIERRDQAPAETPGPAVDVALQVPSPEIIYTTANEESQITFVRLSRVLRQWTAEIGKTNLAAGGVPPTAAKPFVVAMADVSDNTDYHGAALWSRILPVMLLIWALTGAFYPAVDLCAGEKERGTMETLLSSPAQRSEIVVGKLLTVMTFSTITAVLNLASIGLTGWLVLGHLKEFGAPPPIAIAWLLVALIPVSALFSGLCLALAAFARSTKEGQYYLMPLLLITMPLAIMPLAPAVELNLGASLIPVTGVVLLLRNVLEGNYLGALQFSPVVLAVTLAACMLSIRWAIDQFNSESVLFRESERLDLGLRLRHVLRDRQPTPTIAAAVFCGVAILVTRFFMGFVMAPPAGFGGFVKTALVTQLAVVAAPALLMTFLLTENPRRTLLLKLSSWQAVGAAVLLAVVLHPAVTWLQVGVEELYPISDEIKASLAGFFEDVPGFWQLVLVVAVVPAICEELAFRGFILSGFRHLGRKWTAIVYSALFFGLAHALLQQSLIACLVGVVIGYIAVQSSSIIPCILFHVSHNTLVLASTQITPELLRRFPLLATIVSPAGEGSFAYNWQAVAFGLLAAGLLLAWFGRLPYPKSPEEKLQESTRRGWRDESDLDILKLLP